MYLEFYNLKEYPFAVTCDERFFFQSTAHAEALASMMYTVQQGKGLALITGEAGTGKTFLGQMLAARLGSQCLTINVITPPQSPRQLLRAVAGGLSVRLDAEADDTDLVDELERELRRCQRRKRRVALVLDEAQDFTRASLEELRLVWNWEHGGERLVQIVLMGQPDLRHRILEPKWEALRQRVALSYHLGGLRPAETPAYIRHRLKVASKNGCGVEFADEAIAEIHAASDGIPRPSNVLCDNALLVGYARGARRIDRSIVAEVLKEMLC